MFISTPCLITDAFFSVPQKLKKLLKQAAEEQVAAKEKLEAAAKDEAKVSICVHLNKLFCIIFFKYGLFSNFFPLTCLVFFSYLAAYVLHNPL